MFFRVTNTNRLMRSLLMGLILIITVLTPGISIAESEPKFDVTYFDQNSNGLDDRMERLIDDGENVGVILVLDNRPNQKHFDEIEGLGLTVDHVYKYINAIRIDEVPASKAYKLTEISELKLVEWQAPVYPFLDTSVRAIKVRDSSEYSPVVWDKEFYGEGINIAILDTGVDNEHETFGEYEDQGVRRFIAGIDCDGGCPTENGDYKFTTEEDSNEDPDDFNGHGTHTASTSLGTGGDDDEDGDGEPDYIGVAPAARLIDVKVMADWGSGSSADINEAIEACIENVNTDWENDGEKNNGVHVMSMSLGTSGGSDGSDTQSQLVNQANAAGIVVAIAMGNDGENEVPSPAAADWSVAVGAMENEDNVDRDDDDLASYSNYGPRDDDGDSDRWDELKPSVVAPGSDITAALGHSNIPGFTSSASGWTSQSGTSMACPHVAGLAALILEADISLRPTSNSNPVRDRLQEYSETWSGEYGGEPSEPDESDRYNYYYGYGYLDSYEIVDINQPDAFVSELTTTPSEPVEGDTVTISAKIENIGTMDIDEAMIRLIINENEIESSELDSISVDSHTTWSYEWEPDEGDYDISIDVYDVEPVEGDIENNIIETSVSVDAAPAEGVDLAIIEVWTDDEDPIHNEHIAIYAKIRNQGTEKSDSFELRWYDDDERFTTLSGAEVEVEEEITITGEWVAEEGESELLARLVSIEPADQNSNNNARDFIIEVGPPPEEPDFSPANLAVEGTLEEGQEVTISFEILNLGKTSGSIDYDLIINGDSVNSGNLQVNSESSETRNYEWTAEKGTHSIKIVLDNSDPSETTEENNEAEISVEVEESSAKFELVEITWTDPLFKNEQTAVKVVIRNYGGKDGTVSTMLYASGSMIGNEATEIESNQEKDVYFVWTPSEVGTVYLSAQTDYDDNSIGKNAYVQEVEDENNVPIAVGSISVNGIPASSSMTTSAETGDTLSFSGSNSYDSDGFIVKYEWNIVSNGNTDEININQENFDYIFSEKGTYSVTLTVTDDKGDMSSWGGNIMVNEKKIITSGGDEEDSNLLLYGGGTAVVIGLLGVIGLRYFRSEEEDDFFDFEDAGPVNLACPSCGGVIAITTDQRPIQVACPMCQSQFVIRE